MLHTLRVLCLQGISTGCLQLHACRMQILLLLLLPGLNRQGGTKPLPCHRVYMLKHSFTAPCIRNNPPSTATIAPLKAPPGACAATDPDRGCRLSPIPMSATEWDVPAWSVDRLRWGSKDMVELGMFGVEGSRINSKDAFTYGVYSLRAKVNPTSGAVSAFYVSAAGQRRAASCSSSGWMVAVLVAAGAEALGMAFPAQSLGSETHSPSLCAYSQRGVAVAVLHDCGCSLRSNGSSGAGLHDCGCSLRSDGSSGAGLHGCGITGGCRAPKEQQPEAAAAAAAMAAACPQCTSHYVQPPAPCTLTQSPTRLI
jgi:hypothetical protein